MEVPTGMMILLKSFAPSLTPKIEEIANSGALEAILEFAKTANALTTELRRNNDLLNEMLNGGECGKTPCTNPTEHSVETDVCG